MNPASPGLGALDERNALQQRLGLRFRAPALLLTALTHPSYFNEHPGEASGTNERLEFLGDAVLGLVVAQALYDRFPAQQEGRLTEWRAQLVMGATLARVASALGIGEALRLGRGEQSTGGRERERNLERAYEAIVGAVMLDQGLEAARAFVMRTLADEFAGLTGDVAPVNPKGALQELAAGENGRPRYVTVAEEGPEHAREFVVEVRIDDRVLGRGRGQSRQVAEKTAALEALEALERERAASAQ